MEEVEKFRVQAFRAVVKDNQISLEEVLNLVPRRTWSRWENRAGADLLELSEERKSWECNFLLSKYLGMVKEAPADEEFQASASKDVEEAQEVQSGTQTPPSQIGNKALDLDGKDLSSPESASTSGTELSELQPVQPSSSQATTSTTSNESGSSDLPKVPLPCPVPLAPLATPQSRLIYQPQRPVYMVGAVSYTLPGTVRPGSVMWQTFRSPPVAIWPPHAMKVFHLTLLIDCVRRSSWAQVETLGIHALHDALHTCEEVGVQLPEFRAGVRSTNSNQGCLD